jgi:hypothetical protein
VQKCFRIAAEEGLVFELNNRVPHSVTNNGDSVRIHLVVDVSEEPRSRIPLNPGSVCQYMGGRDSGGLRCQAAAPDVKPPNYAPSVAELMH